VVVVELPGFGESDAPKGGMPTDYVEAIASIFQHLELPRVVVVGHALGGLVAAHLTERYPGNVQHLVVVGSGALGPPAEHRRTLLEHIEGALVAASKSDTPGAPGDALHDHVAWLLRDAAAKDEIVDEALVRAYQQRLISWWASATKIRDPSWATPRPPTSIPFTAIWGWHDHWVPVDRALMIRRSPWSSARLFLLTDSGHLPQHEQPAQLARILAAHTEPARLKELPTCLGATKVRPEDHPGAARVTREIFDGTFPAACLP